MTFGERLKALRLEKHLTQTELGAYFHLGKTAISLYETDNRFPDKDTLKKMAAFFDVSSDYLLGLTDIRISHQTGVKEVTDDMIERDFHVGLSRTEEGSLSDEEKLQIRDFAKYIISKRKGEK